MVVCLMGYASTFASSHREAPMIANDPQADNVDVYAFRSPDMPDMVTLIATYIPMQLPHGGPNYYWFGENIHYEIHVDNDVTTTGDDIIYRFVFEVENEDPTTFFNIRLGQQNLKNTYTLMRSMDGGMTYETIITDGYVPPYNVGPRSIESEVGLDSDYESLYMQGVTQATTGEMAFAGTSDDPFFVDLGGVFDLGDAPRQDGEPRDGLACYNVSVLAVMVPISTLRKASAPAQPTNILDPDYVIGVWANASRPAMTVLNGDGTVTTSGDMVQVSRLGMPLTNEVVIPIGQKDFWNSLSPYDEITETTLDQYFYNPELALYMGGGAFADAVPAFDPLNIQTASLAGLIGPDFPGFDFTNGADGLFPLKGSPLVEGTALDDDVFGTLLLPGPGQPRSVDLWPAFHTGVPNVIPYQLATGKDGGNPLTAGKPFVNNFLPNGGDMLRLNMAVPPTPRDDPNFSSLGLIQAAAIGLTVAPFNTSADLEFIPNMDGFPNGRRLEDDVTRIELQAVSGVVLAAVGLWYDDYDVTDPSASPVTPTLLGVLGYTTGVEENDVPFRPAFPYLAKPRRGTGPCSGLVVDNDGGGNNGGGEDGDSTLTATVFASSNTRDRINTYFFEDGDIDDGEFAAIGDDSDGLFFDCDNEILYQVNRSDNTVVSYGIDDDGDVTFVGQSAGGNFTNGRGLTFSDGRIVVADDAADSNGQTNRFFVYNASDDGSSIQLVNTYVSDVNLWGLQAVGETVIAVSDNTNMLAVYNNFFDNDNGDITADMMISVESLVRTHGIFYDTDNDIMFLTDVGSGMVDDDGAFIVVNNYMAAAADGTITDDEQIRVEGSGTFLGNPVDITYVAEEMVIFIAERANGGGRILAFNMPTQDGAMAPILNDDVVDGASAVWYSDCDNDGGGNGGGGGAGADISINVSASDEEYSIYTNTTFTVAVTNEGDQTATNVKVSAALPDGFVNTSNSVTGGGTYDLFFEELTIPTLDPGQTVTLNLTLFALIQGDPVTFFAEVTASDQDDPDSTPGNGDGMNANEDDEGAVTLESDDGFAGNTPHTSLTTASVYPTLVAEGQSITLNLETGKEARVSIFVFNQAGQPVRQQYIQAAKGANQYQLDLNRLPAGSYLIQATDGQQRLQTEWVVKQ